MEPQDEMPMFTPTSNSLDELKRHREASESYYRAQDDVYAKWQKEREDAMMRGSVLHDGFSLVAGSSGGLRVSDNSGSISVLSTTPGGTTYIDYASIRAKAAPHTGYTPYIGGVDPATDEADDVHIGPWVDPMPKIKTSEKSNLDKIEHQMKFQKEARLLTEEEFAQYADELENCKIALEAVNKSIDYYTDKKGDVEKRIKSLETLFEVDADDKYEEEVIAKKPESMTPAELKDMVDEAFFKSGISPSPRSLQSRLENAIDSYMVKTHHYIGDLSTLKVVVSPAFAGMLVNEIMRSGTHGASLITVGFDKISYRGIQLLRSTDLTDTEIIVTEIR